MMGSLARRYPYLVMTLVCLLTTAFTLFMITVLPRNISFWRQVVAYTVGVVHFGLPGYVAFRVGSRNRWIWVIVVTLVMFMAFSALGFVVGE